MAKEEAVAAEKDARAKTLAAEKARRQTVQQKRLAESAIDLGKQIAGPISGRLSKPAEVALSAVETTSPITQAVAYLEFADYYLHSSDAEQAEKQIAFATTLMDAPPDDDAPKPRIDADAPAASGGNPESVADAGSGRVELARLRMRRDELLGDCNSKDIRNFAIAHKAYGLGMVDSDARCNPVDSIGSSTKSRVSHSEPPPSARFPRDKDGSARRNIEPLQ